MASQLLNIGTVLRQNCVSKEAVSFTDTSFLVISGTAKFSLKDFHNAP